MGEQGTRKEMLDSASQVGKKGGRCGIGEIERVRVSLFAVNVLACCRCEKKERKKGRKGPGVRGRNCKSGFRKPRRLGKKCESKCSMRRKRIDPPSEAVVKGYESMHAEPVNRRSRPGRPFLPYLSASKPLLHRSRKVLSAREFPIVDIAGR